MLSSFLSFAQSHAAQILTVWGCLWGAASTLQSVFPPTSAPYKACHVVLALSPLDVVKALRAVGVSIAAPLAGLFLLVGVGVMSTAACTPAASPESSSASLQADARVTVATLESAWTAAANACIAASSAQAPDAGAALRHDCAAVLDPARVQLAAADVLVNAWTDESQAGPLAAKLAIVVMALTDATSIEGVKMPAEVMSASDVVLSFLSAAAKAAPADAGLDGAK